MRVLTKLIAAAACITLGSAVLGCSGAEGVIPEDIGESTTLALAAAQAESSLPVEYEVRPDTRTCGGGLDDKCGGYWIRSRAGAEPEAYVQGLELGALARESDREAVITSVQAGWGIVIGTLQRGTINREESGIVIGTKVCPRLLGVGQVIDRLGIVIGTLAPTPDKPHHTVLHVTAVPPAR